MAYKIRSQLLPTGGLSLGGTTMATTGVITTGSLTVNSGSTTIGASGVAIGGGTKVSQLMYGSVVIAVPQITASGPVVEADSTAIANLATGTKVWLTTASNPASVTAVIATQARVTTASLISGSFVTADHSATSGTCNVTFNYLAFS